jgi:hypothetical protein
MSDPIGGILCFFFLIANFRQFLKNEYDITNSLFFEEKKSHQKKFI